MKEFDAIVVGGGPAGCAAAVALADRGARVALLERQKFPRDKICGDALGPASVEILERLRLLEPVVKAGAYKITGIRFVSPSNDETRPRNPGRPGYTIKREIFDETLFRQAEQRSVTCREESRVLELVKEDSGAVRGVQVQSASGKIETWRSNYVIGADGEHSIVKSEVGIRPNTAEHRAFALRYYVRGAEDLIEEFMEIFCERQLLPGYAWVFPLANGEANIGLGCLAYFLQQRNLSLNKLLTEWLGKAVESRRFKRAQVLGRPKGWPLSMATRKFPLAGDGWMLCGDAASMVDPITGEGIHSALRSGEMAAEALVKGGSPTEIARAYRQACSLEFDGHLRLAGRMQRYLAVPFAVNRLISHASRHRDLAMDLLGVFGSVLPCGTLLRPGNLWRLVW